MKKPRGILLHWIGKGDLLSLPKPPPPSHRPPSQTVQRLAIISIRQREDSPPHQDVHQNHQIIIIYTESKSKMFIPFPTAPPRPPSALSRQKASKRHTKNGACKPNESVINDTKRKLSFKPMLIIPYSCPPNRLPRCLSPPPALQAPRLQERELTLALY